MGRVIAVQRVAIEHIDRLDKLAGALVVVSRVLLAALAALVIISKVWGA